MTVSKIKKHNNKSKKIRTFTTSSTNSHSSLNEKKSQKSKIRYSKQTKNTKKTRLIIAIMFILFFEVLDAYDEKKAKEIIKTILLRIGNRNKNKNKSHVLGEKIDIFFPFIQSKYKIWKEEKSKWDSAMSQILNKEMANIIVPTDDKKTKKRNKSQKGGFYFKSLESKGDKPITGTDITNLLDEIQQFFYNAKYTEEGRFLTETDVLLSLFRGDTETFKFYLNYNLLPKYYQISPPFLKWGAIKEAIANKKYEDYPDYLLAYLSYQKSKNAWEVEQGLAQPINYDASPFSQFANASDRLMTGMAQYRRKLLQPGSMKVVMGMPGGTFIG